MTKVIAQNSDLWTLRKIQALAGLEADLLKKQISGIQDKITGFEDRYGKLDRETMYGQVDDMELIEWEGKGSLRRWSVCFGTGKLYLETVRESPKNKIPLVTGPFACPFIYRTA